MEVFGILVFAQVSDDPAGAMLRCDLCGKLADDGQNLEQQRPILGLQFEQRGDVAFGNDDHVNGVGGARVVEGEDGGSLNDLRDGGVSTQDFAAVEVGWHGRHGRLFLSAIFEEL
jgi:hypothetical protein